MPLSVLRGERSPAEKWTEADSDLAVALQAYEDDLCPGCGFPLSETTDPRADPNNPEAEWGYEATGPVRCYGCDSSAQRAHDHSDGGKANIRNPQALKFGARRVDLTDE